MAYIAALIYFTFLPLAALLFGPVTFSIFCIIIGPLNIVSSEAIISPLGSINLLAIKASGVFLGGLIILIFYFPIKLIKNNIPWFHIIFILFISISMVWSPSIEFGLRSIQKIVIPLVFLFVGFAIIYHPNIGPRNLSHVTSAIIGTAVFMGITSVILKISGISQGPALSFPVIGQAVFSVNIAVATVTAFAKFMIRRQIMIGLLSAFLFLVVVGAFTRSSIAGTFLAMTLIFVFTSKGVLRLALPLGSVFFLISLFLIVPVFKQRMFLDNAEIIKGMDLVDKPLETFGMVAGSGRYELWNMLLDRLFFPDVLFGSGIGSVQWLLYSSGGVQAPHSDYVRLLCDGGLLGFLLFISAIVWYYFKTIVTIIQNKDKTVQEISLSALGSLTVYVVFMATDNAFDYVTQIGVQTFILVGMTLGLSERVRGKARRWPSGVRLKRRPWEYS